MNSILFETCIELIDDAKSGSADMVFKDLCLEILARAKNVLSDREFKTLIDYASTRVQENTSISIDVVE